MFDARIFIDNLNNARGILLGKNAIFKGDYAIKDKIYKSKDSQQTLGKVFLRLRFIPKNIWAGKPFIVSIKNTETREIGKQSIIPFKREFDTEKEAERFIEENYLNQFEFFFEFNRTGEQYFIGEEGIDLEDIEGQFSIEFKSKTEVGLKELLKLFDIDFDKVIKGPSVVAINEILKK